MILQELQFPNHDTCAEYGMYFRMPEAEKQAYYAAQERAVHLGSWQCLRFDTYFNCFSAAKWRKYTTLDNVRLQLELKGAFNVRLSHHYIMNQYTLLPYDEIEDPAKPEYSFANTFEERVCRSDDRAVFEFNIPLDTFERGVVCFCLETLDGEDNVYYGGRFVTEVDEARLNRVDIAIDICTFRREKFVERNIALLNREIINNPASPVNGHLDVFVSDNGQTLDADRLGSDRVHIFPNKNVGGAGGFSRGMIEILDFREQRPFSHVLVMDDDVLINTDAIVRTYRVLQFLRPEYAGKTIAGAMLRLDKRSMQHECGGWWDGSEVHPCKTFLNLMHIDDILINENEDAANYNAWWYSCIPMAKISNENLPLPIFIRFDDVEFGLRTGGDILAMSGICLWHEPFEYKYSSSMEYYHMRNSLIIDSMHRPSYDGKAAAAHLRKLIRAHLVRYRYKDCELVFRGAEDFLKGPDFLLKTDGEALHKEIMAASDKFLPLKQLDVQFDDTDLKNSFAWNEPKWKYIFRVLTFNGLLLPTRGATVVDATINAATKYHRKAAVLNYDVSGNRGFVTKRDIKRTLSTMLRARRLGRQLIEGHARACEAYRQAQKTLTSRAFWDKYLGLK